MTPSLLSGYKEFDHFWNWFDELSDERWAEEVQNDPIARKCLEIGNMIMSKPNPGQFLVDLLKGNNEKKDKDNRTQIKKTGRAKRVK